MILDEPQYVYFIQRPDGQIKIGISKNPHKRKRSLETASGQKYSLLATIQTYDPNLEKELHDKFDNYRSFGEWFYANDELYEFLNQQKPYLIEKDEVFQLLNKPLLVPSHSYEENRKNKLSSETNIMKKLLQG